jgi:type I restriction enzyme S subunit
MYIHYLLRDESYKPEYMRLSTGLRVGQWDLSVDDFLNIHFVLPPKEEQSRIANFLDKKCAEIDELIALQEQMIAQLTTYKQAAITETVTKGLDPNVKMKDSGVEWIGEIPEHWDVCRLKYLTNGNLQYGANESGVTYDANLPRYVRITDILDNTLREDITKLSLTEEQAKDYILQNNDLLFARSGATVGKTYLYSNKDGMGIYAGYLIRFVANTNIVIPKYIYYYTRTTFYKAFIAASAQAVAQPNINAQQYGNLKVCVPPLSLQQLFAQKIEAIEKQKELIKQSIAETEELFNSRMDYYFS